MPEAVIVTVTGASGYIALHVIAQLLDDGHAVRGTLRDMSRAEPLRAALSRQTEISNLTFVQADLTSDVGWDAAMAGSDFVMHVASPVPIVEPKDYDELIAPVRDGTLRVMEAAAKAGVKRVVMTSSNAAVNSGHGGKSSFTEADWSVLGDGTGAYASSKTIAERAAWDFVAGLPDDQVMELVAINPCVVLGPLIDPDGSASIELIRKLVAREVPGCPNLGFTIVDVRDVAAAHVTAMTAPHAAGHRYLCTAEFRWVREIAQTLNQSVGQRGYPVSTRRLPDWLMRCVGVFDPAVRRFIPHLGERQDFDNNAIRRDLNWKPRPVEDSIVHTAESLIALGVV